jgi:hypothetical protein
MSLCRIWIALKTAVLYFLIHLLRTVINPLCSSISKPKLVPSTSFGFRSVCPVAVLVLALMSLPVLVLVYYTRMALMSHFTNGRRTNWPSHWSNGQSSPLQIQRPGFDYRRYQIFWEVVGPERSPLSLVSTIEGQCTRKSSSSGLESREYGRRNQVTLTTWYPLSAKLAITSPTSGCRSVGIVPSDSGHGI